MKGPVSCAPHSLLPIQGLYEPFMTWWRVRKWSPSPIATHQVPHHFSQLRAPSTANTLQTWHASQIQAFVHPFLLPQIRTTSLFGKTILQLPKHSSHSVVLTSLWEASPPPCLPHWGSVCLPPLFLPVATSTELTRVFLMNWAYFSNSNTSPWKPWDFISTGLIKGLAPGNQTKPMVIPWQAEWQQTEERKVAKRWDCPRVKSEGLLEAKLLVSLGQ